LIRKSLTLYSILSTQHYIFLYLGLLVIYILSGTALAPFHGDESTQIYMSRDYAYHFIERDLSKIYYSDDPISPTEQQLRLLNGTVNKYLIGLTWHLREFTPADINEQWDWGADWNYNQQFGHAPSEGLLLASRAPSAILLAAGAIILFVIGWQVGGLPVAYLASLYYTLNPALLLNGRRAMMEGSFISFSLLTVLAGIWLLQRPSWRSTLALGLAAGLALASKHTAIFTVAAVFGACGVYIFTRTIRTWRVVPVHIYLRFFVALLLTGITFLLLNPAWWSNPIERAGTVLELREDLLAGQTAAFGGYANFGEQVVGFLRQSFVALPQYFEVAGWENFIGDQIARYETSVWRGVSIGGSVLGAIMLCIIIGIGAWALIRGRKTRLAARWLVGVWALAMLASTLLLTPIEWGRYYLPIYPAVGLLAAMGLSRIGQSIAWARRQRQGQISTTGGM
jgi:4-amino-4-deoxy-L-arabinose transferase-like glycosyltransferase